MVGWVAHGTPPNLDLRQQEQLYLSFPASFPTTGAVGAASA